MNEQEQLTFFFAWTGLPPILLAVLSVYIFRKRKSKGNAPEFSAKDLFFGPIYFLPTIWFLVYDRSLLFLVLFFYQAVGAFFVFAAAGKSASEPNVLGSKSVSRFVDMLIGAYFGAAVGYVITMVVVGILVVDANQTRH